MYICKYYLHAVHYMVTTNLPAQEEGWTPNIPEEFLNILPQSLSSCLLPNLTGPWTTKYVKDHSFSGGAVVFISKPLTRLRQE